MSAQTPDSRKPKKQRSPSYPSVDLGVALERAEQLAAREGRNFAPIPAILDAWGYGPKSSGGLLAVAALKRFGLIEDRGSMASREARLTELAHSIIQDKREDGTERLQRIQQAALTPKIHRELWDLYPGGLPSNATLRYHLTVERGFTDAGAEEFIGVFRRTLEFAQMAEGSAMVSPNEEDKKQTESTKQGTFPIPASPTKWSMTTPATHAAPPPLQFPVAGGATVMLQTTAPLSEAAWDQMMAVLQTLKPAIIEQSQLPPRPTDERDK